MIPWITLIILINPADNEVFATMMGNFNDGTLAGKMQFGTGWWFLDQKDLEESLHTLNARGLDDGFYKIKVECQRALCPVGLN